jgi:creatinine amidohydrolase
MGKPLIWHNITWPEVKKVSEEIGIAILPIGSTEQHGFHCPCGVDSFNAYDLNSKLNLYTTLIFYEQNI